VSLAASITVVQGELRLDVEIVVEPGEVVAILGPNGAGKTTLLRTLAGLVPLESGRIALDDLVLDDPAAGRFVPPEERPIGVVFQDHLLFPHLDAAENVAFGLRCRGVRRTEARERARAWLERVGLGEHAGSKPHQLSGGQSQRVALARALAVEPRVLLLDEPLSALDVLTRAETRRTLARHLASFEGVRLVVTHDPLEAIALADRLVILEEGRVVQSGTAAEITAHPRSTYVSSLVGVNLYRGRADGDRVVLEDGAALSVPAAGTGEVFVVIHPRVVSLHTSAPSGSPRNVWQGRIEGVDHEGSRVRVGVGGPRRIVAEVTPAATEALGLAEGEPVWAAVKATEIETYSR